MTALTFMLKQKSTIRWYQSWFRKVGKWLKREIVSCKSQIKLVIKQHIFKAFALTGRRGATSWYPGWCPGLGASALYLSATRRWPLVQGVWWLGAFGPSARAWTICETWLTFGKCLQLYKMKLLFVIFLFKKFVLSKNLCIFAATELVCIPLELQASHFFI